MILKWNLSNGTVSSKPVKVMGIGGRDVKASEVREVLDHLSHLILIRAVVSGNKKGAEAEAKRWASASGKKHYPTTADWGRFGERAENVRDQRVLNVLHPDIDIIVRFPGQVSSAVLDEMKNRPYVDSSAILMEKTLREQDEPHAKIESGI